MPPKQRITREMILEKSFTMFCQEGMEYINARSVAKALSCSTQPIFSYFSGMEELKDALEEKAREMFRETIVQAMADESPIRASFLAYFRFAQSQPCLFRQMYLVDGCAQNEKMAALRDELIAALNETAAQKMNLSQEAVDVLCSKLWIYAHGYAALASMKMLPLSMEDVEKRICEAYDCFAQ